MNFWEDDLFPTVGWLMEKGDAGKLDISSLSLNIQIMNQQVCLRLPSVPYLFSGGKVTQNLQWLKTTMTVYCLSLILWSEIQDYFS